MSKPLADWDAKALHPDLIWMSRLDNRYKIEVKRTGEYTAELCMWDHEQDDLLLLQEEVVLAFDAKFGPDAANIAHWQKRAIETVDGMDNA